MKLMINKFDMTNTKYNQTNNSDLDTFTPFQPHLTMNWIGNNFKFLEMKEKKYAAIGWNECDPF